jgi:GR25 family glycosyltransferase involved in LPS biosynthesis
MRVRPRVAMLVAIGLICAGFYSASTYVRSATYQWSVISVSPPVAVSAAKLLLNANGAVQTQFDARDWPAFVINVATAHARRKWVEAQLASVGYTTYTRINGRNIDSEAAGSCKGKWWTDCREGLMRTHLEIWRRIASMTGPEARGYLILEDDILFHEDFKTLWPRYMATVGSFSLVWLGSSRQSEFKYDRTSYIDELRDMANSTAPWGTFAYMLSRSGAAFLARHAEFMFSRTNSPGSQPFYMRGTTDYLAHPWVLHYSEVNTDFFLMGLHHHYFGPGLPGVAAAGPPWYLFESTTATPARVSNHTWVRSFDIALHFQNCTDHLTCESATRNTSSCGYASGRLPITGTGLIFHNYCGVRPFLFREWTGEAKFGQAEPSCASIHARISPSIASEDASGDCQDAAV